MLKILLSCYSNYSSKAFWSLSKSKKNKTRRFSIEELEKNLEAGNIYYNSPSLTSLAPRPLNTVKLEGNEELQKQQVTILPESRLKKIDDRKIGKIKKSTKSNITGHIKRKKMRQQSRFNINKSNDMEKLDKNLEKISIKNVSSQQAVVIQIERNNNIEADSSNGNLLPIKEISNFIEENFETPKQNSFRQVKIYSI